MEAKSSHQLRATGPMPGAPATARHCRMALMCLFRRLFPRARDSDCTSPNTMRQPPTTASPTAGITKTFTSCWPQCQRETSHSRRAAPTGKREYPRGRTGHSSMTTGALPGMAWTWRVRATAARLTADRCPLVFSGATRRLEPRSRRMPAFLPIRVRVWETGGAQTSTPRAHSRVTS